MNFELMNDMFYAAPELWYGILGVLILIMAYVFYCEISILKLKQKNYFLNRDRERYAETLYASKDGYFAFVYPDERVNDPRKKVFERCSRRLAVILSLTNGTNSSFEDILKSFSKEDVKKIQKYVGLLREDGVSFEDEFLSRNEKHVRLSGARINGIDGNIYCDMVWFRDISFEASTILSLLDEKDKIIENNMQLQDLLDNIPCPAWLRDENLNLSLVNKRYLDFVEIKDKEEVVKKKLEILNSKSESVSKNLALVAVTSNRRKKQKTSININGERKSFEVVETPFYLENNMEKICSAGVLIDATELDEMKRNLKLHQNAHLEILGALDTAFAVFDGAFKLSFCNASFVALWKLENIWVETQPNYSGFLDVIRANRMLPETPDFKGYKEEELKDFSAILESKEDLLHLPNGKTLKRLRAPHPLGGLIFAFEDVSDRLATRQAYNLLLNVHREVLDNIHDAVLVFGADGRLNFYNQAYTKMWKTSDAFLRKDPGILEIIDSQRKFFDNVESWDDLKRNILEHITNAETKTFSLNRSDGIEITVLPYMLSDESIMTIYRKI